MEEKELNEITEQHKQAAYKWNRTRYIDAYRKYQASINYGEYERVEAVDGFISALMAKDWSAYENVPSALRYFLGEVSFEESGLTKPVPPEPATETDLNIL